MILKQLPLWVFCLLAGPALGCKPPAPAEPGYEGRVMTGRQLVADAPNGTVTGRVDVKQGPGTVIWLEAADGGLPLTHDTTSHWTIAIELPTTFVLDGLRDLVVDGLPAVARIASEDVVYQSRVVRGTLRIGPSGGELRGRCDLRFSAPMRDHLKRGELVVTGPVRLTAPVAPK